MYRLCSYCNISFTNFNWRWWW